MSLILLLTYPLFSHLAVLYDQPLWAGFYLLLIIGSFIVKTLLSKNYLTAFILVVISMIGVVFIIQQQVVVLMYLPPVVISLGLLLLFGRSLQDNNVPLITRYAQLIDGELNQVMLIYTRRVTLVWSVFFLAMLIESVALAIFTPLEIWSLFTNVLNYLAIFVLFVAEYIYRKNVYKEFPNKSFMQFAQQVMQVKPSQLGS